MIDHSHCCFPSHKRTNLWASRKEYVNKKNHFSYFSMKTYVVGTQNNHLNESSFEHQKQMLKKMGKKMFTILRSKCLFILTSMLLLFRFNGTCSQFIP